MQPVMCLLCEKRAATPDAERENVALLVRGRASRWMAEDAALLLRVEEEKKRGEPLRPLPPSIKEEGPEKLAARLRAEERQRPLRFCDTCRANAIAARRVMELPLLPEVTGDELLVLDAAHVVGLDPVEVLWREVQLQNARLQRKRLVLPGIPRSLVGKLLRDESARAIVEGAKDEKAAAEALRRGKKPSAVRMARKRAKDRLRSK